jgi:hypothetical protein
MAALKSFTLVLFGSNIFLQNLSIFYEFYPMLEVLAVYLKQMLSRIILLYTNDSAFDFNIGPGLVSSWRSKY